jgi:hypothetical protein
MPQTNLTFYTPTKGTMTAFRSKPLSFDIVLSFFIATYIILLYTALKVQQRFEEIYFFLVQGL